MLTLPEIAQSVKRAAALLSVYTMMAKICETNTDRESGKERK